MNNPTDKSYESERDDALVKICRDNPVPNQFTLLQLSADWAKARFEKVIEEITERSEFRHQMALGYAGELGICRAELENANKQLASRDQMIQKLKDLIEGHCGCKPCTGSCLSENTLKIMREACLDELAEWEKTR